MSRRKLGLSKKLNESLLDMGCNEFTMLEFRDAYEARYGLEGCQNRSGLRKWLYRRVQSLVKNGIVKKLSSPSGHCPQYLVSDGYLEQASDELSVNSLIDEGSKVNQLSELNELRTRHNQYQVDMLSYAGECKEYQLMATEFPHLREQIEPMYRSARERSSELLGQLKAIKNILNHSHTHR